MGEAPEEEGDASLPSHGLGKQRFASTRGSSQQHAFGKLAAQPRKLARVLQESHNLFQLRLGFCTALYIRKCLLTLLRHGFLHAGDTSTFPNILKFIAQG